MLNALSTLLLKNDFETKAVLKKLALAHQALAELKGVATSIPNQNILIDTLSLQEAKDSSAIENIITTQDELYRSDFSTQQFVSLSTKEVYAYVVALKQGVTKVKENHLLTINHIIEIQKTIVENNAGFRKVPGTALKNELTKETVYTPPQDPSDIVHLMGDLEKFINEDDLCDWDPLVKMAIIHHQFESIHPFYDGNGRTGRIINILYLIQKNLLDTPILYLSRYINQNKSDYYRLLQSVREKDIWEEWILFILDGIEKTSRQTKDVIIDIKAIMQNHKLKLRVELPKLYSQDFLNILFAYPYTKIERVEHGLSVSRPTATRYLNETTRIGLLKKEKLGREHYYVNHDLMVLLSQVNAKPLFFTYSKNM